MTWPGSIDYAEAVQSPAASFLPSELKLARIATNAAGLPRVCTGAFAVVFEADIAGTLWAVRCFTRDVGDLEHRYAAIQRHLTSIHSPYFVPFHYQNRGILVGGRPYPIVTIQWIRGERLRRHVEGTLHSPNKLMALAAQFLELNKALERGQIGHGDISADNVIVTPNGIKLIDYDGLFVPLLAGRQSRELGNPDFQHPRRDQTIFGPAIDRFSVLVICTALVALAIDRSLWDQFGHDRNGLLFSASDFKHPERSQLFQRLFRSREPTLLGLLQELVRWLAASPSSASPLPDLSRFRSAQSLPASSASTWTPNQTAVQSAPGWWKEHVASGMGTRSRGPTVSAPQTSTPPASSRTMHLAMKRAVWLAAAFLAIAPVTCWLATNNAGPREGPLNVSAQGSKSASSAQAGVPAVPRAIQPKPVPSEEIRRAQGGLARLGYPVGTVDGIRGRSTNRAIENFARDAGIPSDLGDLEIAEWVEAAASDRVYLDFGTHFAFVGARFSNRIRHSLSRADLVVLSVSIGEILSRHPDGTRWQWGKASRRGAFGVVSLQRTELRSARCRIFSLTLSKIGLTETVTDVNACFNSIYERWLLVEAEPN